MTKLAGSKPLVLVLEDEALIALNLQDELQDAGYEVAGPFTACSAALEWLQTATPDMAILDATLKDGSCHERCSGAKPPWGAVPDLLRPSGGPAASG